MKTTVYSTSPYERPLLEEENTSGLRLNLREESLKKDTVRLAEGSEAISVFTNDEVSAEVLQNLHENGVKYITTRTMGVDHIDMDKAKEFGIRVANVPHYSPHSVAEHTIALMLALNRKLIPASRKIRDYNFTLSGLVGFDMNGKTVGILGAGEIGAVSAKILHGFGCNIMIYDVEKNEELIKRYDANYVELDELCRKADIITIHAPLTDDTRHMINRETIGKMKDNVMIINAARGGIVNTEDVLKGLKSGKIGHFGMDVYEHEKGLFFEDHFTDIIQDDLFIRLLGHKNVIITAHQAFLTREALKENIHTTIENLQAWAKGEQAANEKA